MLYKNYPVYIALKKLIESAGVRVVYQEVPDDHIDGAIWARTDINSQTIMMPDSDDFPDFDTACLILGHEMGHILTRVDSPDVPDERRMNEAICDQVGVYLYRLACMIAENDNSLESFHEDLSGIPSEIISFR